MNINCIDDELNFELKIQIKNSTNRGAFALRFFQC
jgi:hypothetical protein